MLKQHHQKNQNKKTTSRRSKIHTEIPGSNERLPTDRTENHLEEKNQEKPGARQSDSLTFESGKTAWQKEITKACKKVTDLEQECEDYTRQRDLHHRKSLLFAHPVDRQKTQEARDALEKCEKELKQARHYLNVELPNQARKNRVPSGWLR